uniref:Uncharacterized protein n=1 Tax=Klebsiella pneumoniae TaxID=573 RepID=A0A8B0SR96_KLEPN|nr:hypothetical protein [Klebsiella pneumoniae]
MLSANSIFRPLDKRIMQFHRAGRTKLSVLVRYPEAVHDAIRIQKVRGGVQSFCNDLSMGNRH